MSKSECEPSKRVNSVSYSTLGLPDYQSCWFFKPDILGAVSLVQISGVGVPNVGALTPCFSGRNVSGEIPSYCVFLYQV